MADESITVTVLKDIRDELRSHGDILRSHGDILRSHDGRLEALERRQVASEIRLATEITAVVGAIHELRDVLLDDRRTRAEVLDHERRIGRIETRLKIKSG